MKKDRLLNPHILEKVAGLGHTEYLCIADCGLPTPKGVPCIDISLAGGIPGFVDVLRAVNSELVSESYIIAEEIKGANAPTWEAIQNELEGLPYVAVSHEQFKEKLAQAACIVRTGEQTPYANIILVGGVNF